MPHHSDASHRHAPLSDASHSHAPLERSGKQPPAGSLLPLLLNVRDISTSLGIARGLSVLGMISEADAAANTDPDDDDAAEGFDATSARDDPTRPLTLPMFSSFLTFSNAV